MDVTPVFVTLPPENVRPPRTCGGDPCRQSARDTSTRPPVPMPSFPRHSCPTGTGYRLSRSRLVGAAFCFCESSEIVECRELRSRWVLHLIEARTLPAVPAWSSQVRPYRCRMEWFDWMAAHRYLRCNGKECWCRHHYEINERRREHPPLPSENP